MSPTARHTPTATGPRGSVDWRPAWSLREGERRVRDLFAETFAGEPAGVWAAPGRVNLIGEHTDYNAGLCLPVAIDHRTFVALRPRADGLVRIASAQEPVAWTGDLAGIGPADVEGWARYAVGVAWAMREAGIDVPGFEAVVDSCVPYGAGLSSSAALEAAFAVALDEEAGTGLAQDDGGRARLVELCRRAENEFAGVPTGGLDQTAVLRCAADHALAIDFRAGAVRQIPAALGEYELLVIDTRSAHQLADGQYAQRRQACEEAASALGLTTLREVTDLGGALTQLADAPAMLARVVRHVVTENARVAEAITLLQAGRTDDLGPLLSASHRSLRDDFEVSCLELDVAADAAVDGGALGARMVGGGFGGSVLALVPHAQVDAVAQTVTSAFAAADLRPPALLTARPAGPASTVARRTS